MSNPRILAEIDGWKLSLVEPDTANESLWADAPDGTWVFFDLLGNLRVRVNGECRVIPASILERLESDRARRQSNPQE
jgi:hypothetical protein